MDPHRFRLATRIHFALLRQYGEDVDVASLLKGSDEGREALWVCEASDERELVELAAQFRRLARTSARSARPIDSASAPQDAAWARHTSGFGATTPPELNVLRHAPAARALLKPSSWLRKGAH
jgi:hypothetical protein